MSSRRDRFRGQTTRSTARHAGHADPQGRIARPIAWVWSSAAHPADFKRSPGDSTGLALSGAVPPGTPGLDRQRMGRVGKQAQGEVLPAYRGGQAQIANRNGELESHDGRDCWNPGDEAGGSVRLWSQLHSWVRAMLRRSRMEREMDAEMRFHMEAYAEDLMQSGVPRQEALRRARLEFGGIERAKEECREARGVNVVESFVQDLRYGLRMLRKSSTFTLTVVLTLAIGIGGNTAMFTVIRAVLLKPLEYRDPGRLVEISGGVTNIRFEEMRAAAR